MISENMSPRTVNRELEVIRAVIRHVLEMETGMRGAEVRGLGLRDIDLSASEIHIAKSKTVGGVSGRLRFPVMPRTRPRMRQARALPDFRVSHGQPRAVLRSFGGYEGLAHRMA